MLSSQVRFAVWALVACCSLLQPISVCGQQPIALAGSGGSVEAPLFAAWAEEFNLKDAGIRVGYVSTSSGEGIRALSAGSGDFAAGEIRPPQKQAGDRHTRITGIPIAIVAVVPVYNLPGARELRFTGDLLAEIYMGRITTWSDERIARMNPDVQLPDLPIILTQRPEGSGTKHIFTDFLCRTSPAFQSWNRIPHPATDSEGVISSARALAEKVNRTPGAIGYVDRASALRYRLLAGSIKNSAGNVIQANRASIDDAYRSQRTLLSDDLTGSLVDAPGAQSYPMIGFVWAYVPVSSTSSERTRALHRFLSWCLTDGQILIPQGFEALPDGVSAQAHVKLNQTLPPLP